MRASTRSTISIYIMTELFTYLFQILCSSQSAKLQVLIRYSSALHLQLRFIGSQETKLQLRFVHIKNQNRCVLLVWICTLLLGTSSGFPCVEFLTVKKTSFSQGYEMTEAQKRSREEICVSPPTSKGIPSCILSFPQRGTSKSFLCSMSALRSHQRS